MRLKKLQITLTSSRLPFFIFLIRVRTCFKSGSKELRARSQNLLNFHLVNHVQPTMEKSYSAKLNVY